jgi:hypothetical protein
MRWNVIFAIAKKDLLEVRQNQSAWTSLLILPLILVVILPIVMGIAIGSAPSQTSTDPDVISFMANMPASISHYMEGLGENQAVLVVMLGLMFAPMFLIMPLMFSSIIGAESFAGERERKTLESLLYTPTTDAELFVGKILAAALPGQFWNLHRRGERLHVWLDGPRLVPASHLVPNDLLDFPSTQPAGGGLQRVDFRQDQELHGSLPVERFAGGVGVGLDDRTDIWIVVPECGGQPDHWGGILGVGHRLYLVRHPSLPPDDAVDQYGIIEIMFYK